MFTNFTLCVKPTRQASDTPQYQGVCDKRAQSTCVLDKSMWQRYNYGFLVPNVYAEGLVLQLWDCCPKDLQTSLDNYGKVNASTEEDILAKNEVITVKSPNVLVHVQNFLRLKQKEGNGVQQFTASLKGMARYCSFSFLDSQTSYSDRMVLHAMLRGLRDTNITTDVMEECALHVNLRNLTLQSVEKLVEAKENAKRSMAEIIRTQEELPWATPRATSWCT